MKKVIVRGRDSGVFFGDLESQKGQEVVLRNVRKLYYWDGACAVEELALNGVTKPQDCKFTVVVDEQTIADMIQCIPCTDEASNILTSVPEWKSKGRC